MQFEETTGLSDQEFMTWLYETYAPLLWGTAKRYCRKQALREEIIQEGMGPSAGLRAAAAGAAKGQAAGLSGRHRPQHHL